MGWPTIGQALLRHPERLDKKANIVQTVDVFMAFSDWVEYQAKSDPEVTVAFMKVLRVDCTTSSCWSGLT